MGMSLNRDPDQPPAEFWQALSDEIQEILSTTEVTTTSAEQPITGDSIPVTASGSADYKARRRVELHETQALRSWLRTEERIAVLEAPGEGLGYVSVSAGWSYTCGLLGNGEAVCWNVGETKGKDEVNFMLSHTSGGFFNGQALQDAWDDSPAAAEPPGGPFTAVQAGFEYACGIRPGGALECWGRNRIMLENIPEGEFASLDLGVEHACAIRVDGVAECWGWSGRRRGAASPPRGQFTDIAAANSFACGIRPGGAVECWGGGFNKIFEHTEKASPPAGTLESITNGKTGGASHLCGLRPGGEAACWGGFTPTEEQPAYYTPPPGEFTFISPGTVYTCGIRPDKKTECWGKSKYFPEAGDAPDIEFAIVRVWADGYDNLACGVTSGGEEFCWEITDGSNTYKQDYSNVADTTISYSHGCKLLTDKSVGCNFMVTWADEETIEFGNLFGEASPPPGAFEEVAAGVVFTCGLRAEGRVECWGRDNQGQSSPPGGDYTDISVTNDYACGLRADGGVTCWGARQSLSKAVAPNDELASVSAGWGGHEPWLDSGNLWVYGDFGFSCGLRTNNTIKCWGDTHDSSHPLLEDAPPEGEFTQVAVGKAFACGLPPDGVPICWGRNHLFEKETYLGDVAYWKGGTAGGTFKNITAGELHACGLRAGGEIACWRYREFNDEGRPSLPYYLNGPYTTIDSGYKHVCATHQNGDTHCWNTQGNETTITHTTN